MNLSALGGNTSRVEVMNISGRGIWLDHLAKDDISLSGAGKTPSAPPF